jgi:hypothetical protein
MIDHGHELSSACVTKLEIDDETQGADDAPAAFVMTRTRPGTGRSEETRGLHSTRDQRSAS